MEAAYHARDERDDHRRRVGATGVEMVAGKSMVGASKCPTTWTHKTALDSPSTGRRPIKQRGICRDRKNWATMMIFGGLDQRHRHAHEGSMKVDFGYVLALDVLPYPCISSQPARHAAGEHFDVVVARRLFSKAGWDCNLRS